MNEADIAQGPVDVDVRLPLLGTEELVSMPIVRYRDEAGNPTCASDFMNGRVCIFYCTQIFGCSETCWFAAKASQRWLPMQRRNGGDGTLVPLPTCPLWHDELRRAQGTLDNVNGMRKQPEPQEAHTYSGGCDNE